MAVIHGRGVVARQPGSPAGVEDITIEDPGPGEVRVKMLTSGVCHTDLFAKEGKFGAALPPKFSTSSSFSRGFRRARLYESSGYSSRVDVFVVSRHH